MFIPDPGFTHPGSKNSNKREGEKKLVVAKNFTELKINLLLTIEEQKLGQFSKDYRTFYPKIVTRLSKIWVWDPGSGKNLSRIPDQGQKGTGSRIRIRNTDSEGWPGGRVRGKALDEERHEDDKTDSHQQNRVPVGLKIIK
jgi:hypothetical protein